MKSTVKAMKVVKKMTRRTTEGLCDSLFDEFDSLRNGESDSTRAVAAAKLAVTIISTKQLEIDAAKLVKEGVRVRALAFQPTVRRLAVR